MPIPGSCFAELGYGMSLGAAAAEPFAGLAFVHLDGGSFAEAGGIAALAGSGNREDVGYSTLGARVATSYPLMNGWCTPRASLAWQHAFGDVTPTAGARLRERGHRLHRRGVPIARDAALLDAGFDLPVAPRATLGIAYFGPARRQRAGQCREGQFTWSSSKG